jgi:hypothetical protein
MKNRSLIFIIFCVGVIATPIIYGAIDRVLYTWKLQFNEASTDGTNYVGIIPGNFTGNRQYDITDVGTDANFVMSQSDQTINGKLTTKALHPGYGVSGSSGAGSILTFNLTLYDDVGVSITPPSAHCQVTIIGTHNSDGPYVSYIGFFRGGSWVADSYIGSKIKRYVLNSGTCPGSFSDAYFSLQFQSDPLLLFCNRMGETEQITVHLVCY